MKLWDTQTQKTFEAEVLPLEEEDFEKIKTSKQFVFDWTKEKENFIFKIVRANKKNTKILGLLSISDYPSEFRIHINLLESSNENKGSSKKVDKIAGCLLAFATRIAFEKGYLGFVSLIPKTVLIKLYINKYGFTAYGRQLALEQQAAINLIQKYL